jgi:hypothetical protein
MGAFFIFDIKFKSTFDRDKFEKKYKITKKQILVDQNSNSMGFTAWTFLRNPVLNPIYYYGFDGYDCPNEIVKECREVKIKISTFAWIPINDKNSTWRTKRG